MTANQLNSSEGKKTIPYDSSKDKNVRIFLQIWSNHNSFCFSLGEPSSAMACMIKWIQLIAKSTGNGPRVMIGVTLAGLPGRAELSEASPLTSAYTRTALRHEEQRSELRHRTGQGLVVTSYSIRRTALRFFRTNLGTNRIVRKKPFN